MKSNALVKTLGWIRRHPVLVSVPFVGLAAQWVFGSQLDPATVVAAAQRAKDHPAAIPVFLFAYGLGTSFFVPATLFHLVSGALLEFRLALPLNLVAFNLVSHLHFALARGLGRVRMKKALSHDSAEKLDRFLATEGVRAAMLIRLIPLPNMLVNVVSGVSGLRWRDFALGTFVGGFPVVTTYTYFAGALVKKTASPQEVMVRFATGALLIVLLAIVSKWLSRRLKMR